MENKKTGFNILFYHKNILKFFLILIFRNIKTFFIYLYIKIIKFIKEKKIYFKNFQFFLLNSLFFLNYKNS
jgi:hypothetical protein